MQECTIISLIYIQIEFTIHSLYPQRNRGICGFFTSLLNLSPFLSENLIVKTGSLLLLYEMPIAPYLWGKMITLGLLTGMVQESCCTDWYNSHEVFNKPCRCRINIFASRINISAAVQSLFSLNA